MIVDYKGNNWAIILIKILFPNRDIISPVIYSVMCLIMTEGTKLLKLLVLTISAHVRAYFVKQ